VHGPWGSGEGPDVGLVLGTSIGPRLGELLMGDELGAPVAGNSTTKASMLPTLESATAYSPLTTPTWVSSFKSSGTRSSEKEVKVCSTETQSETGGTGTLISLQSIRVAVVEIRR